MSLDFSTRVSVTFAEGLMGLTLFLVISLLIQSLIYSIVVWLFLPVTVDSGIIPGGL